METIGGVGNGSCENNILFLGETRPEVAAKGCTLCPAPWLGCCLPPLFPPVSYDSLSYLTSSQQMLLLFQLVS